MSHTVALAALLLLLAGCAGSDAAGRRFNGAYGGISGGTVQGR